MYAAVMHLTFDPELASQAASTFSNDLLPKLRTAVGFRSGYWLDPSDGKGLGLLLFDQEGQARHASDPQHWQAPGVAIDKIEIRRVAATA